MAYIRLDKLPDILYRPWSKTTQAASTLDFEEIKQFLGITNEVDDCNFLDDPFCRNYFEFESGFSDPLVKGRLKSAFKYWRDELCAPKEVLDIIQDGYIIKFVEPPQRMFCYNNNSAIKNSEFVEEAISELLKFNLIEEWDEPPFCVSPLSVADNSTKKRLILDLSKLNESTKFERIVLEDAKDFFNLAQDMKYVFSFDLKSAYHQVIILVIFSILKFLQNIFLSLHNKLFLDNQNNDLMIFLRLMFMKVALNISDFRGILMELLDTSFLQSYPSD